MPEASTPDDAIKNAIAHQRAGRLAEAEAIYREILQAQRDHLAATRMLGILFSQRREYTQAIQFLQRAAALSGNNPAIALDLAVVYRAAGQVDTAERTYLTAIEASPPFPRAFRAFAQYLREAGRAPDAVPVATRFTELEPSWDSVNLLGMTLAESQRFAEAITAFERCIAISPKNASGYNSMGACYLSADQPAKAEQSLRKAVELNPRNSEAIYNLGSALVRQNRHREAISLLEQVIALRPDFALAHANLAGALVAIGDWKRGFEEFEWRLKVPGSAPPDPRIARDVWRGEPLEGQPILLISEGGLGDGLQFARYVPLVAERGGRVTLLCQPPLARLMHSLAGVERVATPTEAIGTFEKYCPLMSLPRLFGTVPENVPSADTPFLSADPADVMRWREKMDADGGGAIRIGIVWAGNPENLMDTSRSIPFDALAPLASVVGVKFYSLQKGPRGQAIVRPASGLPMTDYTADLHDMAETAALVKNLDLVLTADTAVAHVAASTGRPTWLMLAHSPDPRWMVDRQDTPWYRNVRLFRQGAPGNWQGLVQHVADDLTQWAGQQRPPSAGQGPTRSE